MVSLAPSFFDGLENWLNLAVHDLNQEHRMRRRLIEPAFIDGQMRPAGYEFEDSSAGPHRRNDEGNPFAYHPQFVELPQQKVRMSNAFQGLANKLAKLKHDAEFEAEKLDTKVEGVTARMPGVFSRAHGHVDGLAQNLGDVESFVNSIEAVTNGGPPLEAEPSAPGSEVAKS